MLSDDEYEQMWASVKRRVWRLEVQQVYKMPDESEEFEQFLRGEPLPNPYDYPWRDEVKKYVDQGIYVGRVHVVVPPITDYLRYQFEWGYAHTVPVGEEVGIIDLSKIPNPGLPDEDFRLLDDNVIRLLFNPDGTLAGRELVEGPEAARYENYHRLAVDAAVPFQSYWPRTE